MPQNQTQDLVYNITGQSFIFEAPERPASITSVTVLPWDSGDDDTAETATTGSAAVETNPNTTVDANSGVSSANPKLLNVAATTGGEVGRFVLITGASGQKEWGEIAQITSGASFTMRTPLQNDYVSADTVESTRVSISVLDAWIQDDQKITDARDPNPGYRVRWVWVDGASATRVDYTGADVVRYRGADHGINGNDMADFLHGWELMLPTNSRKDMGQGLIDAGFNKFKLDLQGIDVPDQQLRNKEVLGEMTKYAAQRQLAWVTYMMGGDLEKFQEADREYQSQFNRLFKVTSKVATAVDEGGDGARPVAIGVWSR